MRTLRGLSAALVLSLVCSVSQVRADALRQVERTTTGEPRVSSPSSRASEASPRTSRERDPSSTSFSSGSVHGWYGEDSEYYEDDEEDDGDELFLLYVAWKALTSPWGIPRIFDDARLERYADYPYADGPGLLRQDDDELLGDNRKVSLQLDAESGYLLEGVVPGSFAARLSLPHRFELSTRITMLGDVREVPTVFAVSSTSHVLYRHAQAARVDFRSGVGLRTFSFNTTQAGLDFLYAVDAYLSRWSILRIELHAGFLGKAFAGQARATLGMMINRCELYAGYDYTGFSGNGSSSLGGPIAGMRAWF